MTIYAHFLPIELLLKTHCEFIKKLKKPITFGETFCLGFFKHFSHEKKLKNMFVVGILRFQIWFKVSCFGFSVELWYRNLGNFGSVICLATF